jgi:hypothetical protein
LTDSGATAGGDALRFPEEEIEPDTDWIEIGNEFATVLARRVRTRNGARLQVRSPRRELSVFLDATLLDARSRCRCCSRRRLSRSRGAPTTESAHRRAA